MQSWPKQGGIFAALSSVLRTSNETFCSFSVLMAENMVLLPPPHNNPMRYVRLRENNWLKLIKQAVWQVGLETRYPCAITTARPFLSYDKSFPVKEVTRRDGNWRAATHLGFIHVHLWNSQLQECHHRKRKSNHARHLWNQLENFTTAKQELYKRSKGRRKRKKVILSSCYRACAGTLQAHGWKEGMSHWCCSAVQVDSGLNELPHWQHLSRAADRNRVSAP